jgi:peptidoglycan/LPS O-acetylase OafA/YrhL
MTSSSTESAVEAPAALIRQARGQVMGLMTQFLLGMAVNLIGLPSETKGGSKTATSILLTVHMLIAAGLAVGAVLVLRLARGTDQRTRRLATYGAVAIAAAIVAGSATLPTKNNWSSYAMAVAFAAAVLSYGALLLWRTDHAST